MKKRKLLPAVPGILLLLALVLILEERRPYEILHSTVMTSPNLTENRITLVAHTLLPIDRAMLAEKIVEDHQRLNGGRPNPCYELELYRTDIHYRLGITYDTILCDGEGQIVPSID